MTNMRGWPRLVPALLAGCLCLCAAPAAGGERVKVPLSPMAFADAGELAAGRPLPVRINLPLVDRVALAAEDVLVADLSAMAERPPMTFETLDQGTGKSGDVVNPADRPALKEIKLQAGDWLFVAAWKKDWHFNGGMFWKNAGMTAAVDGGAPAAFPLPNVPANPGENAGPPEQLAVPAGLFIPVGFGNRDKWPGPLKSRFMARNKPNETVWKVPDAHGAYLGKTREGDWRFNANGRASHEDKYSWAPGLVFVPAKDGVYGLTGTFALSCAKPDQTVAWLVGVARGAPPPLTGASVALHRARDGAPGYAPDAVATARLASADGGPLAFSGLAPALTAALKEGGPGRDGWVLVLSGGAPGARAAVPEQWSGTVEVVKRPQARLFPDGPRWREGVYARMEDGRLTYEGRPLRLWSTVKDARPERIRQLGYNAMRIWFNESFYDGESYKTGKARASKPGDGSPLDRVDRFMADLKAQGTWVVLATLCGAGTTKDALDPAALRKDDSFLAPGEEWAAWKEAAAKQWDPTFACFDERFARLRLNHATAVLTHLNPYTGKRYAEEEHIALIEVNNESGMVWRWMERGFDKWQPYFRDKLQRRWNEWLAARHPGRDALAAAWGANGLKDGEAAADGTVRLSPTLKERGQYSRARQADFLAFLCETVDRFNREFRDHCRSLAPEETGAAAVPYSFDSQYRPGIPWTYTNWLGDTSTVSMYFWSNNSMLERPPSLYVLDNHRVDGRIAYIYETNRGRPSPYRAEYPYLLAAFASWQDFDIVSWHGIWAGRRENEELLAGSALPPLASHFWTGVHQEHDPVISSATTMAGLIYLHGDLEPAKDFVRYSAGRDAIFGYDRWHGVSMAQDAFTRGARLVMEPARPGGMLRDGQPLPETAATPDGAVRMGPYVLWDWPNGRLIVDSPRVKVYAGRTAPSHRFSDGIVLSGFDTPFVAFGMVSADGRPLAGAEGEGSRRMWLSALFDARNTGMEYDFNAPGGPVEQARAVRRRGHPPVVQDRVSVTVSFPGAVEGRCDGYDFALRKEAEVVNEGNVLRLREQAWYMADFHVARRGAAMAAVVDDSPGVAAAAAGPSGDATETTDARRAAVWNPVKGLTWGDSYAQARKALQDGAFLKGVVSPFDPAPKAVKTIVVEDCEALYGKAAKLSVSVRDGRVREIDAEFSDPPSYEEMAAEGAKRWGEPAERAAAAGAFEESKAVWRVGTGAGEMTVTFSEVQGIVRARYALP